MREFWLMILLSGCGGSPPPADPPAAGEPEACRLLKAPAPGPLAEKRASVEDPLALADLFAEEARRTADAGFYALAETAVACARARSGDTPEVRRRAAGLAYNFHRFDEAAAEARKLTAETGDPGDWLLLGDALHEQGQLDAAAEAYQRAADLSPSLPVLGRIGWLRWDWGDAGGAIEMFEMAAKAGSPADPEPLAWALAGLGWMRALQGQPAPELDRAIALLPEHAPSRYFRGLVRLSAGDEAGAAEDLRLAGRTFDSLWALSEVDPTVSPEPLCGTFRRSCATWLAERDPARALALLDEELKDRQDAVTRATRAYAAHLAGRDAAAEARAALEGGTREPRALLYAGIILKDPALLDLALGMGPGLLPSERARAQAARAAMAPR